MEEKILDRETSGFTLSTRGTKRDGGKKNDICRRVFTVFLVLQYVCGTPRHGEVAAAVSFHLVRSLEGEIKKAIPTGKTAKNDVSDSTVHKRTHHPTYLPS